MTEIVLLWGKRLQTGATEEAKASALPQVGFSFRDISPHWFTLTSETVPLFGNAEDLVERKLSDSQNILEPASPLTLQPWIAQVFVILLLCD